MKNEIKLKEYECICPKCKGLKFTTMKHTDDYVESCKKCHGTGKVDWVARAVGNS